MATYVDGEYWPLNTTLYVTDFHGNHPRFVYYVLESIDFGAHNSGSAQPSLNRNYLTGIPVFAPPLSVQRKIAAFLSAYDDLIENNARRIKLLEEMAQRIYREWFVDFRYPGHENVPLVDSELGPIPASWEVTSIGACASYLARGVSPRYDDDAAELVVNQKCIRDGRLSMTQSRAHRSKVPTDKLLRVGDVLINSTGVGTLGRVAQVLVRTDDVTVDSHVSIVRPNMDKVAAAYWGIGLIAREAEFEAMGAGSTGQTELGRARIGEAPLWRPPLTLQIQFGDLVDPVRSLVPKLEDENFNLRATRDLLLPRLISGEIDVDDLDIQLPEAA